MEENQLFIVQTSSSYLCLESHAWCWIRIDERLRDGWIPELQIILTIYFHFRIIILFNGLLVYQQLRNSFISKKISSINFQCVRQDLRDLLMLTQCLVHPMSCTAVTFMAQQINSLKQKD